MKIQVTQRKGANAIYNDMRKEDLAWTISELERIMIEVAERSISDSELDRNLKEYWTTPQKDLGYSPKHKKQNSAESVIGGILKNIKLGSTRDLTDKACDKIQSIFNDLYNGAANGVLPDLKIQRVTWEEAGAPKQSNSVFEELFNQ